MLFFIGLGISGYNGISLLALNALKTCTIIYIERFTSAICDQDILELDKAVRSEDKGTTMLSVQRWFVEDGREILERALRSKCCVSNVRGPFNCNYTHGVVYKSRQELHKCKYPTCCIRCFLCNRGDRTSYVQIWKVCHNDVNTLVSSECIQYYF